MVNRYNTVVLAPENIRNYSKTLILFQKLLECAEKFWKTRIKSVCTLDSLKRRLCLCFSTGHGCKMTFFLKPQCLTKLLCQITNKMHDIKRRYVKLSKIICSFICISFRFSNSSPVGKSITKYFMTANKLCLILNYLIGDRIHIWSRNSHVFIIIFIFTFTFVINFNDTRNTRIAD